ncbi:MAG: zinc-ribbon domain-containing protein [Chloroflexi bacterium]|nr:zinc-ribbon domain-containing protein [Chloroflexota bacterium]MBU1750656.1 zinc-ribbon domain-containing protein [Chloroflexota bacterium]
MSTERIQCPNCGAMTEPGETFCGECGTRLAVAVSPPTYVPASPAQAASKDSGLVMFLRGSGLILGIVLLVLALLLCGCGGLLTASQPPPDTAGMTSSEAMGYQIGYQLGPALFCCLPGGLLGLLGLLAAIFPFTFGRRKKAN